MQYPVPGTVRWLYLDLNSYFASVEQQLNPDLRGRPMAVLPVMAETTCCIAASYEAKAYGIQTGTDVAEARKLCPEIVFVEAKQHEYARFHHKILEAVNLCLPVEQVLSIDEIACRLIASQCEPQQAVALAAVVKQIIRNDVGECLRCSIGLAPNALLAKIATNMEKPDGLVVIDAADLPNLLYRLSLRDIPGIGERMEIRLRRQKIRSMQDLLALDAKQLRAAWGNLYGERYWYWLRGYDFDEPRSIPQSIGHEHILPPYLRTMEKAKAVAQKLLARATARLRSQKLWARGLAVYLSFSPGREKKLWECHSRMLEAQDVFTIQAPLKRMWADCPQGKPTFVGVELYDLVPDEQHTETFLREERRHQKLSETMDAIHKLFGAEAIYLGGTHAIRDAAPAQIAFASIPDSSSFRQSKPIQNSVSGWRHTSRQRTSKSA
ncbi:DNA polymerase Y family protein [Alloacidobacterium sp.]|uniref:DNA polymerase Y family protein n=1 Tax=Alloacidobacterium sp. TaxID=2951999 RepID=UPI002D4F7B94|nr:DNA polymerase [Alloacidobacterium sp.]HYK34819.1 DNA polymerase [Alloacidobacterium sp.]